MNQNFRTNTTEKWYIDKSISASISSQKIQKHNKYTDIMIIYFKKLQKGRDR